MRRFFALILAALLLCGCAAAPQQSAETTAQTTAAPQTVSWDSLTFTGPRPMHYAETFAIYDEASGYRKITVGADQTILVVPEGAQVPQGVPADVIVLKQPLEHIYVVSSAAMDYFCKLDAVDTVRLSSLKEDGWYLPEAKQAMAEEKLLYAGKYSAPDYETILAERCDLAIENTMIYHTPDVMEQIQGLGIPVIVDRSSYESHPLGRMEWIKFYGALLGKDSEAASYFDALMNNLTPVMNQESTGKTVAFFYITAAGAVNVRKSSDYISKSISLAGCTPIVFEEDEDAGATSSQTIQMEAFYNAAVDADMLIYNSTVDGELKDMNALLSKAPLLADCKAVKTGQVWCVTKNFYQESLALGNFILDVNTAAEDNGRELYFLKQLT